MIKELDGDCPDLKNPDDLLDMVELQTPYAWTASHAGFYLRISHQAETVGVMKIEIFTFPHYKEHYLNLAQNIATLCGLAVSNARQYQRLEIANPETGERFSDYKNSRSCSSFSIHR